MCVLDYRSFPKQIIRAKAAARCPKQIVPLSPRTIASLAWWVSSAEFAAYASAPFRDVDPSIGMGRY